jgi:RHS repeat-associated protein
MNENKSITFAPSNTLSNGVEYTLNVKPNIRDLSGKNLASSYSQTFVNSPEDQILKEKQEQSEHNESRVQNTYLFHGRTFDPISGLYYYRARYLHPELGRFLQPDPMGYEDSMNLYQAFNQNPVNFCDPFGDSFRQFLEEKIADMRSKGYPESYIKKYKKRFKRAYLRQIHRQNAWVYDIPGWGLSWVDGMAETGYHFKEKSKEAVKKASNPVNIVKGVVSTYKEINEKIPRRIGKNIRRYLDEGASPVDAIFLGTYEEVYKATPFQDMFIMLDPNVQVDERAQAIVDYSFKMGTYIMIAEGMQGKSINYVERPTLSERGIQINKVIESFDKTGKPPSGVWQGGRAGHPRGLFLNEKGKLPQKPYGYYTESDIWPGFPGNRGAERLIFGSEGEVYYTPNHYISFVKLR